MSKPAPSRVSPLDRPRVARVLDRIAFRLPGSLASISLATAAVVALTIAPAAGAEDEPAVADTNFRVFGDFEYAHLSSDEILRFRPAPTTASNAPEVDTESGSLTGILTVPLGGALGARVYGGFIGSKSHADAFDDIRQYGMILGGDGFLRDPTVGELGFGAFYSVTGSENSADEEVSYVEQTRVAHSLGARLYGKLFVDDFLGFGPMDVDASALFADVDLDATVDSGSSAEERTYAARGGVKLYPSDIFSLRVGGSWSRTNFGNDASYEDRLAEVDAELLIPSQPGITLGAGFFLGKREQSPLNFQNFGRDLQGVRLSLTVNFAGAPALVDLHRRHF